MKWKNLLSEINNLKEKNTTLEKIVNANSTEKEKNENQKHENEVLLNKKIKTLESSSTGKDNSIKSKISLLNETNSKLTEELSEKNNLIENEYKNKIKLLTEEIENLNKDLLNKQKNFEDSVNVNENINKKMNDKNEEIKNL